MLPNLPLIGRWFSAEMPHPVDTLATAPHRQPLRLCHIRTAKPISRRLHELGLTPGVTVTIIHANHSTLLLAVRGSRVALGRETAAAIHVEPLP